MVMIVFIIIFVHISESNSCNINVCLTWSAIKDEITLKFRVNSLSWTVKFFNQFNKEQAYCLNQIPFSRCFTISKNGTTTQGAKRNITMLSVRGRIDNSINDGWTCYHGTNVDKAVVNVTVLRKAISTGKHIECTNKQDSKPIFKRVMFCMLIIVLILLPLLINVGKDDYPGQFAFIAFGFVMGFPVMYLFLNEPGIIRCQSANKDTNMDTSTLQLTTPSNVETQQENISDEESQQQQVI